MSITVYGLKNCDSCKKTMKYLQAKDVEVTLVDVREHPPSTATLKEWCSAFGRDAFVNKRSTTWRGLSDKQKNLESDAQALELVREAPALMKRPVIVRGSTSVLGFNASDIDALIK